MVTQIATDLPVEIDDEEAMDCAITAWALLVAADELPSSPETRESFVRPRAVGRASGCARLG